MTNEEAIKAILFAKRDVLADSHIDKAFDVAIEALKAQDKGLDQWCTDCKEYDAEHHNCPRFNRVIRTALSDLPSAEKRTEERTKTHECDLPSAEPEPVGCSGCRYERFGNRVCDVCSRFYVDRYEAERRQS